MSEILNGTGKHLGRPPRARRPVKPGILTSELWTTVGALAAALATCLAAEDRTVQLAALGSLTCLGCVLGGLYIWSRTRVKA